MDALVKLCLAESIKEGNKEIESVSLDHTNVRAKWREGIERMKESTSDLGSSLMSLRLESNISRCLLQSLGIFSSPGLSFNTLIQASRSSILSPQNHFEEILETCIKRFSLSLSSFLPQFIFEDLEHV